MQKSILTLLTRTPLHIGAGSSVGAIDQPVVRERHTRFPIIPGSSLKGVVSDLWDGNESGGRKEDAQWLFGSDDPNNASAGAMLIGEGKLLAFPVRSARGSFAWTTCPLALSRFKRDTHGNFTVPGVSGEQCLASGEVTAKNSVILEEYVFPVQENGSIGDDLVHALSGLTDDDVWKTIGNKLVILPDEAFSYFSENACEVAQHIKINDATGTVDVESGALFNQENVPSETLFYSVIHAQNGMGEAGRGKTPDDALNELRHKLDEHPCIQIGADETTGLGWCSVFLMEVR